MEKPNHIEEELILISPLISQIKRTKVYSVPATYFNDFSTELLTKIKVNKQHAYFGSFVPYSIPVDYFKNLPDVMLRRVLLEARKTDEVFEEMEEVAPFLNTISKKPVYSIPEDFFNKLQIPPQKLKNQRARIFSIRKPSRLFRFSVAAVLIPFLAVSLYNLIVKETPGFNNINAKNAVKNLSNEEIVTFLKNNVSSQNASSAFQKTSTRDHHIKRSLKQVSDKEIYQFLKETGESDEI